MTLKACLAYNECMDYKDYYKILGVDRKASEADIKKSYRKLAMKYHPDRNPGTKQAEETFKDINEAYQVLSDSEKRARYDQLGASYANWQRSGGAAGGFNWQDWFTQQPQGQGTRVNVGNFEDVFGSGFGGFSDFFNAIFGGLGGQADTRTRVSRRTSTPNYTQPVKISFMEAYLGTERALQVDGRRLEVKIPPGARTGTKIRVPGTGPADARGQHGDIYLEIEVAEDNRFERQGDDLHTEVSIDLLTAVLGGQANVPTPAGAVLLTIPAGTQPGQTFRLAGRGMPHLKNPKEFGDLYAKVKVQIPRQLSDQQRTLFEKLRNA